MESRPDFHSSSTGEQPGGRMDGCCSGIYAELVKIDRRCACTVRSLSTSRSAISALLSPSATRCRTSTSLEVKPEALRCSSSSNANRASSQNSWLAPSSASSPLRTPRTRLPRRGGAGRELPTHESRWALGTTVPADSSPAIPRRSRTASRPDPSDSAPPRSPRCGCSRQSSGSLRSTILVMASASGGRISCLK